MANKQVWQDGMATEGNVLKLSLDMALNVIEYEKKDKNGNVKTVKINRLSTLAGNNGFGSFIIGKDNNGNKIGIKLTVNQIDDNQQLDLVNSEFKLG